MPRAAIIDTLGNILIENIAESQINPLVGGHIEAVYMRAPGQSHECVGFVNESGKLLNLPINPLATRLALKSLRHRDYIVGVFVVLGPPDANGDATDVPESFINKLPKANVVVR